jgi:hypothetical protein
MEIFMNYNCVLPKNFTPEQTQHIGLLKNSLEALYSPEKNVFGIKCIESSYILASAYATKLVGLSREEDVVGRFDRDLPCKVAEFAQDFIDEEKELISHQDKNIKKSMLNIHEYATGLESFVSYKTLIIHQPSQSILGTAGVAHKIDLSDFFKLIPNYISEFGVCGNIENVYGTLKIGNINLTEYEHETCFLLMTMNMSYKHVASFMNKYRPTAIPRTADTIYKCRDRVCEKLDCEPKHFQDKLMEINVDKKIPSSFLHRLIGNRPLS